MAAQHNWRRNIIISAVLISVGVTAGVALIVYWMEFVMNSNPCRLPSTHSLPAGLPRHGASIKEFIEAVSQEHAAFLALPHNQQRSEAIKFLYARKFDVERSIRLYSAHQALRTEEGLNEIDPRPEPIRRELLSGKCTVLSQPDQRTGASIAIFTVRLHWPGAVSEKDTLRAWVLLLDAALKSESAQRNGIIFIYDMYRAKLSNFDYYLSTKIINMLQGCYPARLRRVLIVTAPLWFRAPFNILRLFLKEKLRQRVYTVNSRTELVRHFMVGSGGANFIPLPQEMGGHVSHSHREWLQNSVLSDWMDRLPKDYFINSFTNDSISSGYVSDSSLYRGNAQKRPRSSAASTSGSSSPETPVKNKTTSWEENCVSPVPNDEEEEAEQVCPASNNTTPSSTTLAKWKLNGQVPAKFRLSNHSSATGPAAEGPSLHRADDPKAMDVSQLLAKMREKGIAATLAREFEKEIQAKEPQAWNKTSFISFKKSSNVERNRYSDVRCLESTRVVLHLRPDSDYIHANWVDGYRQRNAFISAQGPLENTVVDFWSMVWEYYVPVIVMTTRPWEQRRPKCHVYWPTREGEQTPAMTVNRDIQLVIRNDKVDKEHSGFLVSHLTVTNSLSGESRRVVHLFFTDWPDHGVPDSGQSFFALLTAYREHYDAALQEMGYPAVLPAVTSDCSAELEGAPTGAGRPTCPPYHGHQHPPGGVPPPPTVVHCSAGIGRTGTFIAMDINSKRMAHTGRVNVLGSVQLIRSQRAGAVQIPQQYIFLHSALSELAVQMREEKQTEVDKSGEIDRKQVEQPMAEGDLISQGEQLSEQGSDGEEVEEEEVLPPSSIV